MKKVFWVLVVLVALGGGYLGAAHVSGGAYPTPGLPLGGDRGFVRRAALAFWEDIQFKDFARAASYHAPEVQGTVDIPYLIERLFGIKPEMLDIMEYEVVLADIDSTGLRARVKTRLKVKLLVDGRLAEREVMLYFHRTTADAPWFMELESSLRELEADKDKKH
ncbi:MAG: hypothetical protein ACK4YP_04690 [Myxococcota bacterium]